jgi:hypothetical protein
MSSEMGRRNFGICFQRFNQCCRGRLFHFGTPGRTCRLKDSKGVLDKWFIFLRIHDEFRSGTQRVLEADKEDGRDTPRLGLSSRTSKTTPMREK